MTRHRRTAGWRSSQGFSLIELMVSLTIGLIIAAAAFSAYLGISSASKMAEAQGRMNEDAQAALTILTQQLRMAGNNPDQANRTDISRRNPVYGAMIYAPVYDPETAQSGTYFTSNFIIRGCDGTFSNLTTAADLDHLTCAAGINALPDAIAVSYEADTFNTVPNLGIPTDCLGKPLNKITATIPANYSVADNRFYIGLSTSSIPSLYCKGNGIDSMAQALVENVENMQFIYGATAAATTVAGYLRADQILSNASMALLPDDAKRWEKVITVRICLLVRSENPVVSDAMSARYLKCDGTLETAPPDLRLRRAYATTVVLRNRQL